MKKQRTMFQMKEKDKTSGEKTLDVTEKSNLPDKGSKLMVINMLPELGRKMDEHSENFNKEIGNIIKYQIEVRELKNTVTVSKSTLEGFNSRLDETEVRISELKTGHWNSSNESSKKRKE